MTNPDNTPIWFNSKTQPWTWLSNFHVAEISIPCSFGVATFNSVEAAYQFAKHKPVAITPQHARAWAGLTPWQAKQAGKTIDLREDWHECKLGIMAALLRAKFTPGSALAEQLVATGERPLRHLSPWDLYWGMDDHGRGDNALGELLMFLRRELNETNASGQ